MRGGFMLLLPLKSSKMRTRKRLTGREILGRIGMTVSGFFWLGIVFGENFFDLPIKWIIAMLTILNPIIWFHIANSKN